MKRLLCIFLALLVALGCAGKSYSTCTVRIESGGRSMKMKVLKPKETPGPVPGILWIHGGGYMLGGTYMLGMTCAPMLAERFGAVVVFPDYRLAWQSPYPAALEDCYAALEWMYAQADELGIDRSRIVVGGESAGGGLTAARYYLSTNLTAILPQMLPSNHAKIFGKVPQNSPNSPE